MVSKCTPSSLFNSYPCALPGLSAVRTRDLIITKNCFCCKRALAKGHPCNYPNSAQVTIVCVRILGSPKCHIDKSLAAA